VPLPPDSDQSQIACLRCDKTDNTDFILCETCDTGAHAACLGLDGIPEEEWFCPDCAEKRPKVRPTPKTKGAKATSKARSVDTRKGIMAITKRLAPERIAQPAPREPKRRIK
jgi:hypothetical protein